MKVGLLAGDPDEPDWAESEKVAAEGLERWPLSLS